MDQHIAEYIDSMIKKRLDSPILNLLNEQQKDEITEKLRAKLYKAAVEELINRLNEDQLNQIADLDFISPEMEVKIEEFAATIPNFLSILEEKFQKELNS